jgi:anti-sigma B factor antagonist
MTIDKKQENDKLTIALTGKLDTLTSPDLEKVIKNDLAGVKDLIFDLSKVNYVSSAGLRVCLASQKHMNSVGGTFAIKGVVPEVMEVFELAGFTDIIKFIQ